MAAKTKVGVGLDTRGWALALFCDPDRPGIDPTRLTPGRRRHVDAMMEAGWLRRDRGLLYLEKTGREAMERLLPAEIPELTAAQAEMLEQLLEKPTVSDVSHPPTLKLLAYGMVDPVPQRFGGMRLVPNARTRIWAEGRVASVGDEAAGTSPRVR